MISLTCVFSFEANINPKFLKNQDLARKNPLDMSKISSSYLLENIHDHYVFPMELQGEDGEKQIEIDSDYSPVTPVNLQSRINNRIQKEISTPEMFKKVSSSEFGDMSEGKFYRYVSKDLN